MRARRDAPEIRSEAGGIWDGAAATLARMILGGRGEGDGGGGGTRGSKARGGKVSVSGAVRGFASLGVQIFGNGRVGSGRDGTGRDDGLALGLAWAQLAGTGSRWGSKKIFRYLYVGRLWGLQIGIEPMG